LSISEQKKLEYLDHYLLSWGENFDNWTIRVIVNENNCKFLWVFNNDNMIQCFDIPLKEVEDIFEKLYTYVSKKYWPTLVKPPKKVL
jgi:hypothetical protein